MKKALVLAIVTTCAVTPTITSVSPAHAAVSPTPSAATPSSTRHTGHAAIGAETNVIDHVVVEQRRRLHELDRRAQPRERRDLLGQPPQRVVRHPCPGGLGEHRGDGHFATASGGPGSHLMGGLSTADGLAWIDAEVDEVRAGDRIRVIGLDGEFV